MWTVVTQPRHCLPPSSHVQAEVGEVVHHEADGVQQTLLPRAGQQAEVADDSRPSGVSIRIVVFVIFRPALVAIGAFSFSVGTDDKFFTPGKYFRWTSELDHLEMENFLCSPWRSLTLPRGELGRH